MSLRVVHITRDFPPRCCSGLSTAVGGLVEASAATGRVTEISVVSFDAWRPQASQPAGLSSERQGAALVTRVRGEADLVAARAFVEAAAPDVLHVHDGMLWEFALSCGSARRVYTPHVAHAALNRVRGVDERTLSLRGQERALAEADAVIAPSEAAARMVGGRCVVAPLGTAPPPAGDRIPGVPTVLHVGRFDAAKGTDDLLAILRRVVDADPEVACEIVGGLPENAKADRRRRRRIDDALADIRPRVTVSGWLRGAELEAAYARATVLLQPSHLETVGLAVLEGMARGVPPVSTRCGGPEERIEDGVTGRLVDVGDIAGAADATLALLDSPDAFGLAAEAASRAWYWPRVVDRWLDAYAL